MTGKTVTKDERLRELIVNISENKIKHSDIIQELQIIFTKDYKCDYSYIFTAIFEFKEGAIDFITEPLDKANEELGDNLGDNFKDFYSALSIEMRRISLTKQLDNKSESLRIELNNIKNEMDKQAKHMKIINKEIKSKKEQLASINNNHLSVLGIFSGIVMVFFGGLSVASETMKFADISITRLVLIICLIGFIIFNSIFVLIYLIGKLTSTELSIKCNKCSDQIALTCDNSRDKNIINKFCNENIICNPIEKLRNLYPISFYVNSLLLTFITIDFTVWLYLNRYFDLMFYTFLFVISCLFIICRKNKFFKSETIVNPKS